MRDFIAIELKPYQGAILERADEQRSLPSGKARRVVEGHARYRRRHLPVMDGLLRAVDVGALCFGYGKSRSEEHTSELQSLMRISYAVFCLQKKNNTTHKQASRKYK